MKWKDDKGTFMQAFQAMNYSGLKGLLRENPGQVDPELEHRLRFLKTTTRLNSLSTSWDQLIFGSRIKKAIPPAPVFLLGHWRSGTTLLHNMLARDPQFGYPTLTQVFTPNSFLTLGKITRAYLNKILPAKRAMDEVVLGADEPQEDEFALAVMCRLSPYLEMVFPRRREHYSRYLTLSDISADELQTWKDTFLCFLKKMSLIDPRPMLLKSPPHTARVTLLAEMFPDAKFIHIVRNPYRVYQSMWGLYDNYIAHQHLQKVSRELIRDNMLKNYHQMFSSLEADKHSVPDTRFITVTYEDLVNDPRKELSTIYSQLQLSGFSKLQPRLETYLQSISDYQPNPLKPYTDEEKLLVDHWCDPVFASYNYEKNPDRTY